MKTSAQEALDAFKEKHDMDSGLAASFGRAIFWIILLFTSVLWYSYVMSILWVWFVTPAFGILVPGLATLAGLTFMFRLLTFNLTKKSEDNKKEDKVTKYFRRMVTGFGIPLLSLLFGWVAHLFQ